MKRSLLISATVGGALMCVGCNREDQTSNNKTGSANVTPGDNARTASDRTTPAPTGTIAGGSSDASGGTRGSDVTPATQPSITAAGTSAANRTSPSTQPSGSPVPSAGSGATGSGR